MKEKSVNGFSKWSKAEKLEWLASAFTGSESDLKKTMESFWLEDNATQKGMDGFSENTVSNYILPYGLAPNFLVDGTTYCVPMVIEESSVGATASSAAKYWYDRGGFKTTVLDTTKVGQLHFKWTGNPSLLKNFAPARRKGHSDVDQDV